jgi:hypothetical protein
MYLAGFQKATRENIWAKILLISPSGGGKSYSALTLASGIAESLAEKSGAEQRIAFIGTESSRDRYYAEEFDYDLLQLKPPFTPESFINAIDLAINEGYKVVVLDSLTHEWAGQGGVLEIHSKIPGNSYTAWGKVTPRHNKFMDKIIESDVFVIATVRGKDKYVLEEENGKQVPKKVGLGYTQRDDTEYLFTTTFNIDQSTHVASSVKDNTHIFENANEVLTKEHGKKIFEWAAGGNLDEKIKAVQESIDEGKQKQALNEQKEADELAKNKTKSAKKETKTEKVADIIGETDSSVDAKQLIQAIRDEFTRVVGTGKTQKQVLAIMTDAGCAKPTEGTNPETLIAVLNRLKSE